MPWPVHPTGFFGARGDNDSYKIERSLRFNSADSAYLNRTFSGTPTTYTASWWIKRSKISEQQDVFASRSVGRIAYVEFTSSDTLDIYLGNSTAHTTTALFRDIGAWYHFVLTVTAGSLSYLYLNGSQIGTWTAIASPYLFNSLSTNAIGRYGDSASFYLSAILAEVYFIDGQALTPSSFGETDAITGRWKAKAYSGTYGTNGFYLKFADNSGTTATTLGKDSSGNGNNWTPNNFSVTAGAGNDSFVDSPTNYGTDTGVGGEVRGNYCTLNPLDKSSNITLANGNLDHSQGATAGICRSTIGMSSGKWYWEATVTATNPVFGIAKDTASLSASYVGADANSWGYYGADGLKYNNASGSAYGATYTTNDIIGIAFDADAGTLVFYKNGVSQGTAFTGLTSGPYFAGTSRGNGSPSSSFNFGQRPFSYTAPTGFKALCTTNLSKDTAITTSGSFTGNASADGPFVWLNGTPTAMTINGNAVTFQTHVDKLANGFKVRTSSASYNASGSNTFSVSTTERKFKYARAQAN